MLFLGLITVSIDLTFCFLLCLILSCNLFLCLTPCHSFSVFCVPLVFFYLVWDKAEDWWWRESVACTAATPAALGNPDRVVTDEWAHSFDTVCHIVKITKLCSILFSFVSCKTLDFF